MDPGDLELRNATYRQFVELGRASSPDELVTLPVAKLSELAHARWDDRLSPDWRLHTREQNQAILEGLGLTGEFWRLP